MDKGKIKAFAVWARRELISKVSERAKRIGIYEDKIESVEAVQGGFKVRCMDGIFNLPKTHRDALLKQINEKGYEQVIEEVAYTWFNRFMGIRYMEANDYLPSGIRVLSSEIEGKSEPDVLTNVSDVLEELEFSNDGKEEIYKLLDSGKPENREKAYKKIVIKQCNELGKIIPEMFEKISDYTELLFPDNLLQDGSIIRRMVDDIEESDWCEEVEIIGWMYQYYISERKDAVFAALKRNEKISKENIPAATQLFTPKWIVKYMVENSLGRLWIEGHPNEEVQKSWKYYLEEAEQEPEVEAELMKIREEHSLLKPGDIKVLDPCMGSGHILVYAFDVLYEIYKSTGYSEREIPRLILKNNLYGLDIDDRAAQLAYFALIMKARHYNRRLFREIEKEQLELNLCSIQESNDFTEEAIDYLVSSKNTELEKVVRRDEVEYLINIFKDAKEYGSILDVKEIDFDAIEERLVEIKNGETVDLFDMQYRNIILEVIPKLLKQAKIMSRKYEVCSTNPPYMANGFSENLDKFIKEKYKDSKYDLYGVFIEKCMVNIKDYGITSMITQQSWMFISSYEKLRKKIFNKEIMNMIHLGTRAFEEISGEVVQSTAFSIRNNEKSKNYTGIYFKLDKFNSSISKHNAFLNGNEKYLCNNINFNKLPGNIVAYWLSDKFYEIIEDSKKIGEYVTSKAGIVTGNDSSFLRLWYEVNNNDIKFKCEDNIREYAKYHIISKGGGHRRYYGNNAYVILLNNLWNINSNKSVRRGDPNYYFKSAISWSYVGNLGKSFRNVKNSVFGTASPSIFLNNHIYTNYLLGFLNGSIANMLLSAFNPTMNLNISDICNLPLKINSKKLNIINNIVSCSIIISKKDWDSFETSWDFEVYPLVRLLDKGEQYKLEAVFLVWETECEEAFEQLKYNEEELNRIFIDIYGLQDELTPEVEDKDITIRKADRVRDVKSLISYYTGCLFGRYSIDAEGLIYAGGDFSDKWQIINDRLDAKVRKIEKDEDGNIISDSWVNATFIADGTNIIPITDDEYFEDDIVARFAEFIKTVYGDVNLEENLDFIADSIGRKDSETSRQAIRRYFIKDFYKDHLKIYQKRPIYWMFDSGKNGGFKCLIYMHRYNEQTVARIRTDYLHPLQRKYEARINTLQMVVDSADSNNKDKAKAKKEIERIRKQVEECREYDQVVAHIANEKINIDLDDGVKVNYAKFQDVSVINSKDKDVKMNLLSKI